MRQYEAMWRHGTSILQTMVGGAALVCPLLAVAMLALQLFGLSEKRIAFDPAGIKAVDGNGFVYTLSVSPPFPGMVLQSDDASRPLASRLTLTENGFVFGSPHSFHARISSEGGGRFSHWGPNTIYFSTSDNTDPRTNGRTYAAILPFKTPTWVWLVALASASVAAGILFPGRLGSLHRVRSLTLPTIVIGAALVCTLPAVAMLALQLFGLSEKRIAFDPADIKAVEGGGFIYPLSVSPPFPGMVLQSDSANRPYVSRLTLTENGAVFGTPHSLSSRIASEGGGLYSHWGTDIYFSISDNTNPQTNGRTYAAILPFKTPTWVWLVALASASVAAGMLFPGLHGVGSLSARLASRDVLPLTLLALATFLQVSLVLATRGDPVILNNNDAGNISGWIAGRMHADRLSTDFLVGHPEDTAFYISAFLVVVRGLAYITNDIGLAYLWTYLPVAAFLLIGFYLLGLKIAGTRVSATVLALMTSVPIWIWGQNDLFGLFWLPLVRNVYDAALPYFLLLFLTYGSRAPLLPILFAAYGLTVYLHPVSAPAGAVGLWLGCLALRATNEGMRQRLAWLVAGGAAFIAMAVPFAVSFFSSFSRGEVTAGSTAAFQIAMTAFQTTIGAVYYDAILALTTFLSETGTAVWPIWTLGLAGLLIVPTFEPDKRRACRFMLLFLLGCLLGSVGISFVDQTVSRWLHRNPFQIDLIRGLRLTVVPLLAGFALLISLMQRQLSQRQALARIRFVMPAAAVLLVAYWWGKFPNRISDQLGFSEIPTEYTRQDPDATRMLDHLRSQPVDGLVLPIGNATVGLAVRYAALQPVAFIRNDMNALLYGDSPRRPQWAELFLVSETMFDVQNAAAPDAFTALVARSHAKHVVLENGALQPSVLERVNATCVLEKRFGRWSLFTVGK